MSKKFNALVKLRGFDLFLPNIFALGPWSGEFLKNFKPSVMFIASYSNNVLIGFSASFSDLSIDTWQGPIESTYGSHLVKVLDSREEYQPSFEEVIPQVKVDFIMRQRDEKVKEFIDELKTDYQVVISPSFRQ